MPLSLSNEIIINIRPNCDIVDNSRERFTYNSNPVNYDFKNICTFPLRPWDQLHFFTSPCPLCIMAHMKERVGEIATTNG